MLHDRHLTRICFDSATQSDSVDQIDVIVAVQACYIYWYSRGYRDLFQPAHATVGPWRLELLPPYCIIKNKQ